MRLALGSHSDMGSGILIEFVSNAAVNTRRTADACSGIVKVDTSKSIFYNNLIRFKEVSNGFKTKAVFKAIQD
jgi:hypothetical protein